MKLIVFPDKLAICRLSSNDSIPAWASQSEFFSITKTSDEISIVCAEHFVPTGVKVNQPWRAIKVEGPLDFSLIGILSSLTAVLASEKISVFVLSTFDTDYLLVQSHQLDAAVKVLTLNGHVVEL